MSFCYFIFVIIHPFLPFPTVGLILESFCVLSSAKRFSIKLTFSGAGLFLTTMVVAMVVLTKPFDVMRRPLIRDLIFFLLALVFSGYILSTGRIRLIHSIGQQSCFLQFLRQKRKLFRVTVRTYWEWLERLQKVEASSQK